MYKQLVRYLGDESSCSQRVRESVDKKGNSLSRYNYSHWENIYSEFNNFPL